MKKPAAVLITLALAVLMTAGCSDGKISGKALFVKNVGMKPKIEYGDTVLVNTSVRASEINTGDIIAFYVNSDKDIYDIYLVHRVVKKYTAENGTICFITKGDANETADAFVIDEGRLIGRVEGVMPGFYS